MSERRLLLCTDLDRTLLPNGAEPESPGARPLFARLVAHPEVTLVYVTGRDRGRVEAAMGEWSLPRPDLVAADVGTSLFDLRDGRWARSTRWDEAIAADWCGHAHAELAAALSDLPALVAQDASQQGRFKLSYTLATHADLGSLDEAVATRLEALGVCAGRIWSTDEMAGVGLLDVVPARADKLHALHFAREQLGAELGQTLFAGDSGNDLAVLASAVPAVLVANAQAEIAEQARALLEVAGNRETLYLARGGWRGMNGCYAAGILEGVAHYHPRQLDCWIDEAPLAPRAGEAEVR